MRGYRLGPEINLNAPAFLVILVVLEFHLKIKKITKKLLCTRRIEEAV